MHFRGLSFKSLLVLTACIAIVGSVSFCIYNKLLERAKTINTLNQIATVVNNTYSLYNWNGPYSGLGKISAIMAKILPKEMIVSPLVLRNPFSGNVDLSSVNEGEGFAIMYSGLPSTACVAIATTHWGTSGSSGLRYMMISQNGYLMPKFFPARLNEGEYSSSQLPLDREEAEKHCVCHSSNCSVLFFFD